MLNCRDLTEKLQKIKQKIYLLKVNWIKVTLDSSYFIGKNHFDEDGTQSYLVFQPLNKYFAVITNIDYILPWKSKGLSAGSIKPPTTSDNSLTPAMSYYGTKTRVIFTGSCLKQLKISYTHGKVVNI